MFFSKEEKRIMGNLFRDISIKPHKVYILKLEDGSTLEVQQDTCYESDNGLEEDDDEYLEYNACTMQIKKVINDETTENLYKEQMLIEINYLNYPKQITDLDGRII